MNIKKAFLSIFFTLPVIVVAQPNIPDSHHNLYYNDFGELYLQLNEQKIFAADNTPYFTLSQMQGNPKGTEKGIALDFNDDEFNGTLYFGFIDYNNYKHPQPVFFRTPVHISEGKTEIPITAMKGKYDMIGWETSGKGTIGFRVVDENGQFLYDGKVSFKGTGPFEVDATLVRGPFICKTEPNGAVISYETREELITHVEINNETFKEKIPVRDHVIEISGLQPATSYQYTVHYGGNSLSFQLKTAHENGARRPFTFAYASDSRAGQGGGERNMYGVNAYIMKKIMALSSLKKASFFQFSGDLISGYSNNAGEMRLQYANWKNSIESFAHYFPVIAGMGNHESLNHAFINSTTNKYYAVDQFPFATRSSESLFAEMFVNPLNGPDGEDDSVYDPKSGQIDFPTYSENVFYYTYDNVAMVVLNSNYWYAPSRRNLEAMSGNLHGYIMDNQLKWFTQTMEQLEDDPAIDHIFVTLHTPFFPNGGHVADDMWYNGNNRFRPYINGEPVEFGIIERRDQLLDIIVNQSEKTVAILTGDEHNYNKLKLTPETPIYPKDYGHPKIELSRTIYQINNGAAGAPYYAQEQTPWTDDVSGFTTQNAVVFFHVDGKEITMEVINPDTLEPVDSLSLR